MRSWKRYVAAGIVNIAVALIVLLLRGFDLKIYYVDALSVAGAVSILLGMLSWVAGAGAFDTIAYGFSTFRSQRKYKDLYEYVTSKSETRKRKGRTYVPFLVVGAAFIAVSFLVSVL